jgi:hypothetical protein
MEGASRNSSYHTSSPAHTLSRTVSNTKGASGLSSRLSGLKSVQKKNLKHSYHLWKKQPFQSDSVWFQFVSFLKFSLKIPSRTIFSLFPGHLDEIDWILAEKQTEFFVSEEFRLNLDGEVAAEGRLSLALSMLNRVPNCLFFACLQWIEVISIIILRTTLPRPVRIHLQALSDYCCDNLTPLHNYNSQATRLFKIPRARAAQTLSPLNFKLINIRQYHRLWFADISYRPNSDTA